jgi:predicted O-methyltransferase YrrM
MPAEFAAATSFAFRRKHVHSRKAFSALRKYALSTLSCLYLIGGGFLRSKHRLLLHTICSHFGFEKPLSSPEPIVPPVAVDDLIGNSTTITLAELEAVDGNVSLLELVIIASLVRKLNPKLSLEIGTFDGRTTLNMALNQSQGTQVVTLDLPAAELPSVIKRLEASDKKYIMKKFSGARFAQKQSPGRIIQLYGDSSRYDYSEYHNQVDLIFIDGSHSYDFVLNDSLVALSLVRDGGVIVWHDYNAPPWFGVTQALNELFAKRSDFQAMKHISGTSLCVLQR